jgi:hypothetical protein
MDREIERVLGASATGWRELVGIALLAAWLLLTLLYNAWRAPMRRLVRPWDGAMLLPGWRLFSGIPRHLTLWVRELPDHGPPGAWRELRVRPSRLPVGGLVELESQRARLVYQFMDDLTRGGVAQPAAERGVPLQGIVAFLTQQTDWSRCDRLEFQIVYRARAPERPGSGVAPAAILYRSPAVACRRGADER